MDDNQIVFRCSVTNRGSNVKASLSDWHRQARIGRVACISLVFNLVDQGLFWFVGVEDGGKLTGWDGVPSQRQTGRKAMRLCFHQLGLEK